MINEPVLEIMNLQKGLEAKIVDESESFVLNNNILILTDGAKLFRDETLIKLDVWDPETNLIIGSTQVKMKVEHTTIKELDEKKINLENILSTKKDVENRDKPEHLRSLIEFN